MERTNRVIRPPQVDDVWWVKLHHDNCSVRLDEVLVSDLTLETVELVFIDQEPVSGSIPSARYRTRDVVWVELVRVMPRLQSVPCQTNPESTEPPSESQVDRQKLPGKQPHHGRWPGPRPTPK